VPDENPCRSEQSSLLGRLFTEVWIALHTRGRRFETRRAHRQKSPQMRGLRRFGVCLAPRLQPQTLIRRIVLIVCRATTAAPGSRDAQALARIADLARARPPA